MVLWSPEKIILGVCDLAASFTPTIQSQIPGASAGLPSLKPILLCPLTTATSRNLFLTSLSASSWTPSCPFPVWWPDLPFCSLGCPSSCSSPCYQDIAQVPCQDLRDFKFPGHLPSASLPSSVFSSPAKLSTVPEHLVFPFASGPSTPPRVCTHHYRNFQIALFLSSLPAEPEPGGPTVSSGAHCLLALQRGVCFSGWSCRAVNVLRAERVLLLGSRLLMPGH